MFSWLLLLTCWSWGLGAQWCGLLLCLCRVQTGHNPLMSVAQRSRPGSSETGTWYQSCRCQKTLDLKVERCLRYWSGVLGGYFDPPKEKYGFLLPLHHREVTAQGQLQNSTPCFWEEFNVLLTETSVGWMFALTHRFQLKNSFPAHFTAQPCSWYSHCPGTNQAQPCVG